MGALIFIVGDEQGVFYLVPAPEALNYMARAWWASFMHKYREEWEKGNRNYGTQLASSIAAAYEIQSWELDHKASELSKACFFRKLALALAPALTRKAHKDTLANLKAKYAFGLLVKATFVGKKCLVYEALRLAKEAISLNPSTAGTKMLLARILLWLVCDFDSSEGPVDDLELAIKYIEECVNELPDEFSSTYGANSNLQRALEARYILQGTESDFQGALSLAHGEAQEEKEDPDQVSSSYPQRLSSMRQKYLAGGCTLNELLESTGNGLSNDAQFGDHLSDLPKLYHLMIPGLATEAMEAGLQACQSPAKVEEDRRQPASNFILGMHYLIKESSTSKDRQFDLENAIAYLRIAETEGLATDEQRLQSSIYLAEARWRLAEARKDITLMLVAMNSMALLLDELPDEVSPPSVLLINMMAGAHSIWKRSQRREFLSNAVKYTAYLLRESQTLKVSPQALSVILSKGGEIAMDIRSEQPDQTILEEPLIYWKRCWQNRRASLNVRLHAMHLASQYLFKEGRIADAFQYAKKAVELIRFACPAQLDRSERVELVPLLNGISVDACALGIELGRNEEALELLEQGRGILNFLPDAFTDSLNKLRCEHPQLYKKFDRCRQKILVSMNSKDPAGQEDVETEDADGANENCDDIDQLTSALAEIRHLPTFKNFYRPISISEMQSIATTGPIVVLVGSPLHPYAMIVQQRSIQTVDLSPEAVDPSPFWDIDFFQEMCSSKMNHILGQELVHIAFSQDGQPELQYKTLSHAERATSFRGMLSFIWVTIVEPINRILGYKQPAGPAISIKELLLSSVKNHITWIRTGYFSRMPLHAAMNGNFPFMFRAVNSYAMNFESLFRSHSRRRFVTAGLEEGVLVTMPSKISNSPILAKSKEGPSISALHEIRSDPNGGPFLKAENVQEEVSAISQEAPRINWSVLERPSVEEVKDSFEKAGFMHFICHGVEDPKEPRRSHLKLWEETKPGRGHMAPLFVSEISSWKTKKTALVFLSACSNADIQNTSFSDENLNIANSFAVAGVPDVVGSMWPVSSLIATSIASTFWSFLSFTFPEGKKLIGDNVAGALHMAVLTTAVYHLEDPFLWSGFIHIGGMGSQSLEDMRSNADNEEDLITTDEGPVVSGDED